MCESHCLSGTKRNIAGFKSNKAAYNGRDLLFPNSMIRSTSLQHDAIGVFFSSLFAFLLLLPLLISKLTLNTIPRAAAATVGVFAPRASGTRKDGDHGMLAASRASIKEETFLYSRLRLDVASYGFC